MTIGIETETGIIDETPIIITPDREDTTTTTGDEKTTTIGDEKAVAIIIAITPLPLPPRATTTIVILHTLAVIPGIGRALVHAPALPHARGDPGLPLGPAVTPSFALGLPRSCTKVGEINPKASLCTRAAILHPLPLPL